MNIVCAIMALKKTIKVLGLWCFSYKVLFVCLFCQCMISLDSLTFIKTGNSNAQSN